ncbi:alpha/beta hydrolase [Halorussus salilacus]|uniref:alpha/beta hydrolase n=1 Tax=Halorussus salilacus TaxID=2953750 RepID=UPI0020A05BFA|nr:alpha/beta hydrolase [Halorussus salilacus]USZ66863.1 alpha/beta hydrolase [Halorussus salilacus]
MSEPHPDMEAIVSDVPPLHTLSVEEARAGYADYLSVERPPASLADVQDSVVPGPDGSVPIRVYTPDGPGPFPVLVWMHGGGFLLGDVESYDPVCRVLADELDCIVVSPDYRLAPEHPFPAGLRDCYATVEWAATRTEILGADSDRLIVGGDSAGGNLAAAVSLLARDKGGPDIDYQVLVYPTTTFSYEFADGGDDDAGYFITEPDLRWSWEHYLERDIDGMSPYASPLRARDLSGLPPATVLTATFDPLQEEGIAYAERLADHGVAVEHTNYDDMIHSFFTNVAEPRVERAWEAVSEIDAHLRDAFDRETEVERLLAA